MFVISLLFSMGQGPLIYTGCSPVRLLLFPFYVTSIFYFLQVKVDLFLTGRLYFLHTHVSNQVL